MKKILIIALSVFTLSLSAEEFISPINFQPTAENKQKVIDYIKKQVYDDYSEIGMGDPTTLRMMEKENLDAFKELTSATDTKLLKQIIKTYCEIGMCNYSTFLMMYNEESKAKKEKLKW